MSRQGAVVCGYFGFANAGDEAVLAGLVYGLRKAGYSEPLTVLSANPAYTEREHGVQAIPRTGLQFIWRAMRRARLFVLGGGSLLQDVTSARSIVYYLGMHALARRAGCRIAWIGQGIGPLCRSWARRWVARAAEGAETIVVRDPASADLLREMGVSRVEVGADLSFLLPSADIEYGWQVLQGAGACRDDALIALAPRRWAGAEADVGALLADLMQYARREWSARALLLAMQAERDGEVVREVAAKVSGAVVLSQPLSVRDVQGVLACCQIVIGVRLHALMLAAASGIPALAVSYDPKVRAFWQQVAAEYVVEPEELNAHTLRARLNSIWEERQELRKRVSEFAEGQRRLAERNISALLALVR